MKPAIYFDAWNIVPCRVDGAYITDKTIDTWDEVTHQFLEDWPVKLLVTDDEGYNITIQAGLISDGGSIPKPFRNLISPWGRYAPAFFIHDVLYMTEYFPRAKCDWLLLESCQALGASWYRRNQIWAAVKLAGGLVWARHKLVRVKHWRKFLVLNEL